MAPITYEHREGVCKSADGNILPGSDLIGCGYNILTYYADSRSCGQNLFKLPEDSEIVKVGDRKYAKPTKIIHHSSYSSDLHVDSGSSIQDYIHSINSTTKIEGNYSFFSASVEAEIGKSTAENSSYVFSKVKNLVRLFTLQLPSHHASMLHPQVKHDIDNMSDLTQLFDTYNTHYLKSLIVGGVANYTSSTSKLSFQSKYDVGVVATMSFKAVTGSLSAEEKLKYEQEIKSFQESSQMRLQTRGGDPALAGQNFPRHVKEWRKSVMEYMAFVEFLDQRSLTGIWELASTNKRRREILDFYHIYCKSRTVVSDGPPYLRAKYAPLARFLCNDGGDGVPGKWLSVSAPDIGGGWHYLGQIASQSSSENLQGLHGERYTLVVQEIKSGSGALADVHHWEKVWDDHGDGKKNWYSLWRGVPANPVDYVVLGDLFRGNVSDSGPPTKEETAGIKAIHKDLLAAPGKVDEWVWDDAGGDAADNASVWTIRPQDPSKALWEEGVLAAYFVSANNKSDPRRRPTRPVYVLKRSAVSVEK